MYRLIRFNCSSVDILIQNFRNSMLDHTLLEYSKSCANRSHLSLSDFANMSQRVALLLCLICWFFVLFWFLLSVWVLCWKSPKVTPWEKCAFYKGRPFFRLLVEGKEVSFQDSGDYTVYTCICCIGYPLKVTVGPNSRPKSSDTIL